MQKNYNTSHAGNNSFDESGIDKFDGSFDQEESGCTIFVNETINLIRNLDAAGFYSYLMCRPSRWKLNVKQLTNHFECNKDKIYKLIDILIELGLLTRTQIRSQGKFVRYHYRVHLRPINKQLDQPLPNPEKPDTVKPDTVNSDTYKTKNVLIKEDIKTSPLPPKGLERFDEFWNLYPKKKGRAACESKWKRSKLDEIANVIIAKLTNQVQFDDEWLRGYAPNPSTYLNQRRWEDEITQPKDKTTFQKSSTKYDDNDTSWRHGVVL